MWHWKPSPHGRRPEVSDTPKTDAFREVIFAQYKEDELTGDGMGNILAALPDIEAIEIERDELRSDLEFRRGLFQLQEEQLNNLRKERDEARERVKELTYENENLYHRLESVGDGVFVLCRKLKAENEKLKQQQQ